MTKAEHLAAMAVCAASASRLDCDDPPAICKDDTAIADLVGTSKQAVSKLKGEHRGSFPTKHPGGYHTHEVIRFYAKIGSINSIEAERKRKVTEEANKLELLNSEKRGELVPVGEVRRQFHAAANAAKGFQEKTRPTLGKKLANEDDVAACLHALEKRDRELLQHIAEA